MTRNQADEPVNEQYLWQLLGFAGVIVLVVLLIRLLLPLLLTVGAIGSGWWAWHWYQQNRSTRRAHFNALFYELIQANGGRITILDFAMTAHLPASDAQQFLDDRAKEFSAHFEVTDHGDVIYCFQTVKTLSSDSELVDSISVAYSASPSSLISGQDLGYPLTQAQLAERLNLSPTTIRRKKTSPDFSLWSQTKDPQNILWRYVLEEQRFYPEMNPDRPSVDR
ncbi:MAG: hypothetical protein KME16_08100 [Scytolyngbya sp. HA4215-MV1]|nr:hypothetical protein [Scytolyngbya sp. HA4215-MV1]